MKIFRRVLRLFFVLLGFLSGVLLTIAAIITRRMVRPPRQPLWSTPASVGLDYEEVHFPAAGGLRLSGWFIPGPVGSRRKGATILLIHGWQWNRLGDTAEDALNNLIGTKPVDLLRLAYALHQEGFQILMYDSRNHGESAAEGPVTFGQQEAQDVIGALNYLQKRADVPAERMGVIGFSAGANALLYALPQTELIAAAVAVQPASGSIFFTRAGQFLFGRARHLLMPLVQFLYRMAGGADLTTLQPATALLGAPEVPVLYIQGDGDPWGSVADVQQMADNTKLAQGPLWVESTNRFDGYQYIIDNPKIAAAFFEQHFLE